MLGYVEKFIQAVPCFRMLIFGQTLLKLPIL